MPHNRLIDEQSLLPGEYLLTMAYNSFSHEAYAEFKNFFEDVMDNRQIIIDELYNENMLFLDRHGKRTYTHHAPEHILNKSFKFGRYLINSFFSNIYEHYFNNFIVKSKDIDNVVISVLYKRLFDIARRYDVDNVVISVLYKRLFDIARRYDVDVIRIRSEQQSMRLAIEDNL